MDRTTTNLLLFLAALLLGACSEQKLDVYDASLSALNIAKGNAFGPADQYPEQYAFNAYFLGANVQDHVLHIPVRLQGLIDHQHDRTYRVVAVDSATTGALPDVHYTLSELQTFRRGLTQDSITLIIHINQMDEEQNYKLRLALQPGADFQAGITDYQYIDISFTKNLSIAPPFWENNSKLRRISYSPRKCAVFLQISGLTDPNWTDDGSTVILEYWISLCEQWFLQHEEYDADGNRIYFN